MSQQTINTANAQIQKLTEEHLTKPLMTVRDYNNKLVETQRAINQTIMINKAKANPFRESDPAKYLTNLIDQLKENVDLKLGIIRTKYDGEKGIAFVATDPSNKSAVVIRDSRLQPHLPKIAKQPNDVSDNWMINASATARGVLKLIELSDSDHKEQLKVEVMKEFHKAIDALQQPSLTPEIMTHNIARMNYEMKQILTRQPSVTVKGKSLSDLGDKEFSKIIVNARDFTSFDSIDHPSTISISADMSGINHIASFVPVVPLSRSSNYEYYHNLQDQKWYKKLDPIDQALVSEYRSKISDDRHIIPTQLQHLPGVHNYGLTSTFFANDNELSYYSCATRSAAPAHDVAKKSSYMQDITDANVSHIMNVHMASGKSSVFCNITNNIADEAKIGKAVEDGITKRKGSLTKINKTPLSVTVPWDKHDNLETIADAFVLLDAILHADCKSGKDRTGLADKYNNIQAIITYMRDKKIPEEEIKNAVLTYNAAWHNEALAAGDGGSLGCMGLKASTSYKGLAPENQLHLVKDLTTSNKVCNLNIPEFTPSIAQEAKLIGAELGLPKTTIRTKLAKVVKKVFSKLTPSGKKGYERI